MIVASEPLKLTRTQKTAIQKLASERTGLKAEQEQIRKQLDELVRQLGANRAEPARRFPRQGRPGRSSGR